MLPRMKTGSLSSALRADPNASREFRDLRRAIAKANGDREAAIRKFCRTFTVRSLDALPAHLSTATPDLLPRWAGQSS